MPDEQDSALGLLTGGLLPLLNEAMPDRLVPVLRTFLQDEAGASAVEVLLADYELSQLRRLGEAPAGRQSPTGAVPTGQTPTGACAIGPTVIGPTVIGPTVIGPTVGVADTDAGRCFTSQAVLTVPSRSGAGAGAGAGAGVDGVEGGQGRGVSEVLVPLSLRAERLGVLRVSFDGPVTSDVLRGLQEVALATTYVLVACGSFSDLVEIARRAEPLSVAAEMQWNLQPLRAFHGRQFAIAGQLIPAYEVGGDCYDYNVAAEHLDLSSLDAMGHGVRASVLAALATAVMRNTRRAGGGPVEQVRDADRQLLAQFDGAQFVTALAMRLDLRSGQLELVNAGHPRPWLVRDGHTVPVQVEPSLPAGLLEATGYRSETVQLQAGDRLVVVTDGVLEAGAPGVEFGEERLEGLLLGTADLTPHQCVAEVLRTVRAYAPQLHDDATVICLDWHGAPSPEVSS